MSEEKSLRIQRANNSMLWEIKFDGGGQLPNDLVGLYTSKYDAQRAIEVFQSRVRARVARNAKASKAAQ